MKADAKVKFGEHAPEKFTNFEWLQKDVEVLKETVDKMVSILNANNIIKTEEIEAEYFNDDEVFRRLEED